MLSSNQMFLSSPSETCFGDSCLCVCVLSYVSSCKIGVGNSRDVPHVVLLFFWSVRRSVAQFRQRPAEAGSEGGIVSAAQNRTALSKTFQASKNRTLNIPGYSYVVNNHEASSQLINEQIQTYTIYTQYTNMIQYSKQSTYIIENKNI